MLNFEFKRTNRKCHVSGRVFSSGEDYVSLLIEEGDELIRRDISIDEFDGPPENCVGWWKSKVPDLTEGKVYWAPKDVLLSYFNRLIESQQADHIYVMAILLLQKKHLQLRDTIESNGKEIMQLFNIATKELFEVEVVEVSADRIVSLQSDLAEKLFTDIAPNQAE